MKTIFATILFLGLATQMNAHASVSVMPQVGSTSFNITKSGLSSKSGIMAGASVSYELIDNTLSIESGLQYLEVGAKMDALIASVEYNLNYIAVPLLANWSFYKIQDHTQLYLKGGAIATQLISAEQKYQDFFGNSEKTNVKDQVAKNDILMTIGAGGKWKFWEELYATLDLNYVKGTTKTIKGSDGNSEGYILAASLVFTL